MFTLFRTFKNIIMDLMVQKYRFSNERYIKQINIWEKQNNGWVLRKKVMSKKNRVTTQGRKEKEVGILLLGNDKNNVIVNYLLS